MISEWKTLRYPNELKKSIILNWIPGVIYSIRGYDEIG